MKIVITGGAGYVGSKLSTFLAQKGHQVKAIDIGWFGLPDNPDVTWVKADIRDQDILRGQLAGAEVVVHLACISNDPSFELDPELGKSVNGDALEPLFLAAADAGVSRFIYASSSSVYGIKSEARVTEDLEPEPLTQYSQLKLFGENLLLSLDTKGMEKVIVRPSTVYGVSSRQRLDLVVNLLTYAAYTDQSIKVFGGNQFRPNIHILDMVHAYDRLIDANSNVISSEVFNVGSENLTVLEIAELVQEVAPFEIALETRESEDLRSYRVDSTKFEKAIGFKPSKTVKEGIRELFSFFQSEEFQRQDTNLHSNVKRMLQIGAS